MKKTIIAAAALVAMTACNKTLIETPMTDSNYGYINLGITADTEMVVTKADESTDDYLITLVRIKDDVEENVFVDKKMSEITSNSLNKVPAGNYYIKAQNVTYETAYPTTGTGFIYRTGQSEQINLTAGETKNVTVNCHIQNTGVSVSCAEGFTGVFANPSVTVSSTDRTHTFSGDGFGHDKSKVAYYKAETEEIVNAETKYYGTLTIKVNATISGTSKEYTLTSRKAYRAEWNKITLATGDNGQLNITIAANDSMNELTEEIIKIDPVTGAEITDQN